MITTISIDDALMEKVDEAAKCLGLTRSGLIAEAVQGFLRRRRQAQVAEQLSQAHASAPSPEERRLTRRLKTKLPLTDRW